MSLSPEMFTRLTDKSIFSDTMVELTWQEVEEEAKRNSLVLFPISVVEEHGPHMDLSPDIYVPNIVFKLIKYKLKEKNINSIIAPPFYWGINKVTKRFPGSFTVKPETFKAFLFEIVECLKSWGFKKIFILNFHGDSLHCSTLNAAVNEMRNEFRIDIHDLLTLSKEIIKDHKPFFPPKSAKYKPDIHAGAIETSRIFAFFPDKVKINIAKTLKPQSSFNNPLGYVGDPAHFEEENGKESIENLSDFYVHVIELFLK